MANNEDIGAITGQYIFLTPQLPSSLSFTSSASLFLCVASLSLSLFFSLSREKLTFSLFCVFLLLSLSLIVSEPVAILRRLSAPSSTRCHLHPQFHRHIYIYIYTLYYKFVYILIHIYLLYIEYIFNFYILLFVI